MNYNLGPIQRKFLESVLHYETPQQWNWSWVWGDRHEHHRLASSLTRRGLIEPNTPRGPQDRQSYRLTPAGRTALAVPMPPAPTPTESAVPMPTPPTPTEQAVPMPTRITE